MFSPTFRFPTKSCISWWTFQNFFFCLGEGKGESKAPERGGVGFDCLLKIPGGGGVVLQEGGGGGSPRRGGGGGSPGGGGAKGPGVCLRILFSGPKCPSGFSIESD